MKQHQVEIFVRLKHHLTKMWGETEFFLDKEAAEYCSLALHRFGLLFFSVSANKRMETLKRRWEKRVISFNKQACARACVEAGLHVLCISSIKPSQINVHDLLWRFSRLTEQVPEQKIKKGQVPSGWAFKVVLLGNKGGTCVSEQPDGSRRHKEV